MIVRPMVEFNFQIILISKLLLNSISSISIEFNISIELILIFLLDLISKLFNCLPDDWISNWGGN